ncbi:MAG: YfiT family bacillithiol transferase [Vicinamibacterales bacterium]
MDPRYPTGRLTFTATPSDADRAQWIAAIGALPAELKATLAALPPGALDRPYREGGWTVRQVVHHLADSHVNAYCRMRLTLTETDPTVRPYEERAWAELPDAKTGDPAVSVALLEALHARWHALLLTLAPGDFTRPARHPEHGAISLDWLLQVYAWHGRHHLGHIKLAAAV